MIRHRSERRGYALMLVMVFVVLFTAILGVAWRRVASALRVEHVSEVRKQCDQGSLQVLAEAMKMLETCLRLDRSTNIAKLPTSSPANEFYEALGTSPNVTYYIVTFAPSGTDTSGRQWTVSVKTASAEQIGSRACLSALLDNPNS